MQESHYALPCDVVEADASLGVFINQEKAYWTYKDEYIGRDGKFSSVPGNRVCLKRGIMLLLVQLN